LDAHNISSNSEVSIILPGKSSIISIFFANSSFNFNENINIAGNMFTHRQAVMLHININRNHENKTDLTSAIAQNINGHPRSDIKEKFVINARQGVLKSPVDPSKGKSIFIHSKPVLHI
jgi:hypothetical protein